MAVWLDQNVVSATDAIVPKDDLLSAYNATAKTEGYQVKNRTSFGLEIKKLRPDLFKENAEAQRTINGSLKWVWTGVGLRDKRPER